MALTAAQRLSCYEIASVILQDTATVTNNYGIVLQLSNTKALADELTRA